MRPAPNVWDDIFRREGRVFARPHEDMPDLARLLRGRGARTLLDVGSGSGRHVVYFARHGLAVRGVDRAPEGLRLTRQWLAAEGLTAGLCRQDLLDGLPYRDASFDALIAIQVIHHAPLAAIRRLVADLARVLKPGGVAFVTVPADRDGRTPYEQIEPGTFVPLGGLEAGLPHHYFTPAELREEFRQFAIADIHLDAVNHYCLLASKR